MTSNSGAYHCAFLRPIFLLILFEHVANALPVKRRIVVDDAWLNYKQRCPGGKSHNYCNKIQLFGKPSVHHVALNLQSELHAEEDEIDLYTPDITGCVKNVANHLRLLDQSLERASGKGIFRRINDVLWEDATNFPVRNITTALQLDANTRFGILSHGTQPDPIYNYGNTAALNLFEQTIDRLCETPSRYSTVPELMEDRSQLLKKIESVGYGYINDAVRTTVNGKLFIIKEILFWPVYKGGVKVGAAALYDCDRCIPYKK